jgi:DNA polymerase III subunit alpha
MDDLELYFEYRCWKGLAERGLDKNPKYIERLKYEMGIIRQTKFCQYFLVVADFIAWAKKNDIPVGCGRGSGVSSLVVYCLKITEGIDPVKFDLIFERFLNPSRISSPDFSSIRSKKKLLTLEECSAILESGENSNVRILHN